MSSPSMANTLTELKTRMVLLERDVASLSNGKKSAAPVARKSASDVRKLCSQLRVDILNHQKSIPVVKRVKKAPMDIDVEAETQKAVEGIPVLIVPEIDELPPAPPKLVRQRAISKKVAVKSK